MFASMRMDELRKCVVDDEESDSGATGIMKYVQTYAICTTNVVVHGRRLTARRVMTCEDASKKGGVSSEEFAGVESGPT